MKTTNRARHELASRGWEVHDRAEEALADAHP
jgi:hypothetical protein